MRGLGAPFRPDRPAVAELTAGAVVADPDRGRILLLHQVAEDRWCLPKGHVDPGESVLGAARREVAEESGVSELDVRGELCQVAYRFYDAGHDRNVFKTTVYFLAFARNPPLRLEPGFDRGDWVSPSDAIARVRYESDRTVLQAAEAALRAPPPGSGGREKERVGPDAARST